MASRITYVGRGSHSISFHFGGIEPLLFCNDIGYLAEMFVDRYCTRATPAIFSTEARQKMMEYHWPGNVRQLENMIIYVLNVLDSDIILPRHLPDGINKHCTNFLILEPRNFLKKIKQNDGLWFGKLNHIVSLKEEEGICIRNAMVKAGNNIVLAAELLGVTKTTLYRKLKMFETQVAFTLSIKPFFLNVIDT
jgi:DNA-binding NtrC family response regulator